MSNKHIIEKLIDEQEQLEEQIKQLKEKNENLGNNYERHIKYLEEENKKLKEECGAMDVIEKLNQEFDDLQNINQKLVEENEYKTEQNKKLEINIKILALYTDYQIMLASPELNLITWWNDRGSLLVNYDVLDKDIFEEFQILCQEWFNDNEVELPPAKLENLKNDLKNQFDNWYIYNVCVDEVSIYNLLIKKNPH